MATKLPFSHLRVDLRGLTVAGRVWNEGDLIPLDGSTLNPINPSVLEQVAARQHPHLTAGAMQEVEVEDPETGEKTKQTEFRPIRKAVKLPPDALADFQWQRPAPKEDAGGDK